MPNDPRHDALTVAKVSPAAILFDCDGTLLLTAEIHFNAIAGAARLQGADMPRPWYMALTGLGRRDLFAHFTKEFGLTLDVARLVADSVSLTAQMSDQARENPLVADLARRMSGHVPIAVVTNSEDSIAKAFLGATGLLDLFDAVLTVEDAPHPKPAPDLYLAAAARLSVAPETCLVLEDSQQGLAAAKRAGMTALDVRTPDWWPNCKELMGLEPSDRPTDHQGTQ